MGQAVYGKMAIDSALPFDTGSTALEFVNESVARQDILIRTEGIRGTRTRLYNQTRDGGYTVSGSITIEPNPNTLNILLPYILGGSESGDNFPLAENVPSFHLMIDRDEHRFIYSGCKVNRATFSASEGGLLQLVLDIEALTETLSADAFPAINPDLEGYPYIFADCAFTILGSSRKVKSWSLVIDNLLATDQFYNNLTRQRLDEQDRSIQFTAELPYDSAEKDVYNNGSWANSSSAVIDIGFGEWGAVWTLNKLVNVRTSPVLSGKTEVMQSISGEVFAASIGDQELTASNDNVPSLSPSISAASPSPSPSPSPAP